MKRGFTLIELLVYMALLGFIIVVAGRVFSDSTVMRVRSQNMIANAEQIGKLSALLNEDVSQMGTKVAWGDKDENGNYDVSVEKQVYIDPDAINQDYSSYKLFHRSAVTDSLDSLVFRKVSFDIEGKSLGVREISWYVARDSSIYRKCTFITGEKNVDLSCPADSVLMGTNIEKFYLTPSAPGVPPKEESSTPEDTLFGRDISAGFSLSVRTDKGALTADGGSGKKEVTLSGFAGNDINEAFFNQFYLGNMVKMIGKSVPFYR